MQLDCPALASAGLKLLDACVLSTKEERGNNLVAAFKVDKWCGRLDQIMCSRTTPPQLRQLVLEILGQWTCLCETDRRWGARSRGAGAESNTSKCQFGHLVSKYVKAGAPVPLPADAPAAVRSIAQPRPGGGPHGRPAGYGQGGRAGYGSGATAGLAAQQASLYNYGQMHAPPPGYSPNDHLPIGQVIATY